jgi:hypothetical protein
MLWTERDLVAVQKELRRLKVPFALWNLFEDARIEQRFRQTREMRFEWTRFEPMNWGTQAGEIFFMLVQHEGDSEAVKTGTISNAKAKDATADVAALESLFDEVLVFYQRTLKASTSWALMPILTDWCKRFPESESHTPSRGNETAEGEGAPDLAAMLEGQLDPEAIRDFDANTIPVAGAEEPKAKAKTKGIGEKIGEQPDGGNADLLGTERFEIETARVTLLAERLSRLFVSQNRIVTNEVPGRRLSARHFATDLPFYRHKKLQSRGRSKTLVVVDCSGSMNNLPIEEGRVLVAALNLLAQRGIVSGHVVLSAVTGRRAVWQRFALPMKQAQIERIHAFGDGEGLEGAIRNNLKLAQEADFVFAYTDAQIVDKPIDKSQLHLQGVHTWGLYIGSTTMVDKLTEYFDKAIIRDNAEHLVEAMLVHS